MTLAEIRSRAEAQFQALLADARPVEERLANALHLGAMHARLRELEDKEAAMVERVKLGIAAEAQAVRDEFAKLTA